MVTNIFGNKKFHATNEKAQHALMGASVFFFSFGTNQSSLEIGDGPINVAP
jgi:hypothetical protein